MTKIATLQFPELHLMEHFQNDFKTYFNSAYHIFVNDFVKSQPQFEGKKVSAPKFPLEENIHRTFYHITHEGEDEKNRQPDIRRLERIRFPKFKITNYPHSELLVWKNKRGKDRRIIIWNEAEEYVTILTERSSYLLLCTAYLVTKEHRKRKLRSEYEAFIKANTAQGR